MHLFTTEREDGIRSPSSIIEALYSYWILSPHNVPRADFAWLMISRMRDSFSVLILLPVNSSR